MTIADMIARLRALYPAHPITIAYHPDADPGDGSGWCVEVEEVGRTYGHLAAALQQALEWP